MPLHCPDEQCKKRVEDMEIEMKAKQKITKFYWLIFGLFGIGILASFANMWSNDRNMATTYCTIPKANEISFVITERIRPLEISQAQTDLNISYIKDTIKVMGIRQEEMYLFLQKIDKKVK